MDRQTAAVALQLLQRTNLTGAEVDAFQRVIAALADIARGSVVMMAPPREESPAVRDGRPSWNDEKVVAE